MSTVGARLRQKLAMATLSVAASASGPQYSTFAGAEAMWEVPAHPAAILFLAHGCQHAATDFFFPTANCPHALGLPEEVRLVKQALAANVAVIAISSRDRRSKCWDFEVDGPIVRAALQEFRSAASLPEALPLVALGASSGGAFVLQLPALVPNLTAVVSQIMGIPPYALPESMPPTLFVHMPRDGRTASMVSKCMHHMKQKHRNTSGHAHSVHEIQVPPQKPTASFFRERIERLDASTAEALHTALQTSGLLDAEGFLRQDPRGSAWREAIRATPRLVSSLPGPTASGPPDSLRPDKSAVAEALNVAWAMHEIVSDPTQSTLKWLANFVPALAARGVVEAGEL